MKDEVLDAASFTRTLESMLFAPSAVARTRADRDSPNWYDISFATFSTVLSMEVARDKLEKFAYKLLLALRRGKSFLLASNAFVRVRSDYCIVLMDAQSLSLSRCLAASASLPFQGSSQSD